MLYKFITAFAALTLSSLALAGPTVEMQTSKGSITIELNSEKAPISSANFLKLVKAGHYNGTIFHRVIDGFMVQGGGFTDKMLEKPTKDTIRNESKNGLTNARGTIAMARTNDPHSANAQFFINTVDNPNLNYPSFDGWGYAVFGKVTKGMETVDAIAKSPTGVAGGMPDVPVTPVLIKSVKVVTEK